MNRFNLAGILRTCAEKCSKAENDRQLKKIIAELKVDLEEEMEANHEND